MTTAESRAVPPERRWTILFADHAPGMGGAEYSLLWLMEALVAAGHDIHLATPAGPLADRATQIGVTWHRFAFPPLRRSADFWLTLRRQGNALDVLARSIHADFLHSNTVRTAFYGAVASSGAMRWIWHMRDFWLSESKPRWPWMDAMLKRWLCRRAAAVVANSRAVAAHLPCGAKTAVVYNGLPENWLATLPDGEKFRRAHAIPAGVPVIGTVGRLRPWKGQKRFLQAAARVAASLPTARFLIVGGAPLQADDDYVAALHALAEEPSLIDKVIFTGQLEDVRPALAAMDLFVHVGDPEPFGLVNIEAMAAGLPLMAFAHGALPEIVMDGETGLLLPPGDLDGVAAALVALWNDPARRRTMGLAGQQRVARHFTVGRTFQALSSRVYAEIAGSR